MEIPAELIQKYPSLKKFEDANYVEWRGGREARLLDYIYAHPSLESFRGNPSAVRAAMDAFARDEDFLINIGPHKADILAGLVAERKPRVVVELGGYVGYSALLFGEVARKAAAAAGRAAPRVLSIEAEPLFAAIAMSLVDLAGLSDVVRVVTGKASGEVRRLQAAKELEAVDLLFLDHVEKLYLADFEECRKLGLLQSGAMVVADNVLVPGAPEYREYVRAQPDLESHGVVGLIIPGDKKVNTPRGRIQDVQELTAQDEMEITLVK